MNTKRFHISDVLTITTGALVSTRHMEGVYDILKHMTGDELFTHQLPRAAQECKPWLTRWFPAVAAETDEVLQISLTGVESKDARNAVIADWLALMAGKHGETFDVPQIPADDHERKSPLAELNEMVGADRVIVVAAGAESETK